jgi:DnaJ like chaperone protein
MKRNRGKLFGAALGFSFGGPIGALLGTAIGHLVDITDEGADPGTSGASLGQSRENLTFVTSLVYLLVGTARSDGEMTRSEHETIGRFFQQQLGYGNAQMLVVNRIVGAAAERDLDLSATCADISKRTEYEERLFLVRLCYEVALSDLQLNPVEDAFIQRAAQGMGIAEYDFMMVRRTFVETGHQREAHAVRESKNPHAVLGVQPGCSIEEVQRAYRELASRYHPDKVSHLGQEFIDLATSKFAEIQNAYEAILKRAE